MADVSLGVAALFVKQSDLCEQRLALTAYLLSKVKAGDWHGVADAAMDLREIEAKLSVLRA